MPRKDSSKPEGKKPAKPRRQAAVEAAAGAAAETPGAKAPAHFFDDPLRVKRAIQALFAVCGLTFVFDFVVHRHVDHPWEGMIGFYAVYGFAACVLLVLIAKEMRKLLMRKDGYYDD